MADRRILLTEQDIPTHWYNLARRPGDAAPAAAAPRHRPARRAGRPRAALPDVADRSRRSRPTAGSDPRIRCAPCTRCGGRPRCTARLGLEQALGTDCTIFYKYEGGSPGRLAQAEHGRAAGVLQPRGGRPPPRHGDRRGQWGPRSPSRARCSTSRSRSTWCARRTTPKPYRRSMIETWGARWCRARRRTRTPGRGILAESPDSSGSLGIAISEAVEDAATRDDTKYALGSVLNHVLLHQTVIGQEAKAAARDRGRLPRRRHRLHRRRLELRRASRSRSWPTRSPAASSASSPPSPPPALADPRPLRLRLRRHRAARAAPADAHARPRLRAGADPRRRPALPRHGADGLAPRPARAWWRPSPTTRTSASARPSASPAPRASSRRPSRRTRSARWSTRSQRAQGGGDVADDPLQPLRPRALRPLGLRRVPGRQAGGPPAGPGGARPRRRGARGDACDRVVRRPDLAPVRLSYTAAADWGRSSVG